MDSVLSPDQHGFRSGMSVDSNIEFFNEKFYSAMDNEKFYDIMLVDFKKAFDSVSHEAIFALIKQIGLPMQHCNAIQALFNNAHCFTTTDRSNPLRIDFHAGVKQGCPLSPTLFILLMDVLHDMSPAPPRFTSVSMLMTLPSVLRISSLISLRSKDASIFLLKLLAFNLMLPKLSLLPPAVAPSSVPRLTTLAGLTCLSLALQNI